ncbi:MAG: IS1380 family transposase, partial [Bacteroidales bacterium]|nr:IS1380 family transposase [Bacteroidales bacterium]
MAKIQLKSVNINPFGGLFPIFKQFDRSGLRQTIDSALGKRGTTKAAFTYGDVFASLFGSYLCGGDCVEDLMDVKSFWDGRDKLRVCSSDVALRTLRKLSSDNVTYKSTQEKSYDFNTNERMNTLLLKYLAVTGQLGRGDCVSLDFDHQFIAADKKDAKYSYKKADGYFPG